VVTMYVGRKLGKPLGYLSTKLVDVGKASCNNIYVHKRKKDWVNELHEKNSVAFMVCKES